MEQNINLDEIWVTSVEAEGIAAALLLRQSDSDFTSRALPLLREKLNILNNLINNAGIEEAPQTIAEPDEPIAATHSPEPIPEPILEENIITTPIEPEEIPVEIPSDPLYKEISKEVIFIESDNIAAPPVSNEVDFPETISNPLPDEPETEIESVTELEPVTEIEAEKEIFPLQAPLPATPDKCETDLIVTSENENVAKTIKLDEKLSRKISGDIRKAFSLNDKFLFRRELFGNSTSQYNSALDLISEMTSYEEAEAYFIDNCGWDAENANVKSFMQIIRNHFCD